jgi:hypothetical protein
MAGKLRPGLVLAAAALLAAACGSSSQQASTSPTATGSTSTPASALAPIHGAYAPKIDPSNFVSTIDNPYLMISALSKKSCTRAESSMPR